MKKYILVINSGSATLKFSVFDLNLKEIKAGLADRIGLSESSVEVNGEKKLIAGGLADHAQALMAIMKELQDTLPEIACVGHRVVHGGIRFVRPTILTPKIIKDLEKYNKLAPLHNPINLSCIKTATKIMPAAGQVAVFDTAYYSSVPDYARLYGLPLEFSLKHEIRKYGFHGISHRYAAQKSAEFIKRPLNKLKIITCHLGSGCSITATKFGQAIATTMGFTPLEGLMMSTRCGDLDASIPLFLIDELKMTPREVRELLNEQSGLLGIAGTMDMREILAAAGQKVVGYKVNKKFTVKQKDNSILALQMFIYNIVRYIGQFQAIMGGIDAIVFTGGVGEHSPAVRQLVLKQIKHLGKFHTIVVPANEELMIAQEIRKLLK